MGVKLAPQQTARVRGGQTTNPDRRAHKSSTMSKAGMGLEFSCGENPSLVPAVATPYGSSGLNPDQYVDHMEKALQGERPRHVPKPRARPVGIS